MNDRFGLLLVTAALTLATLFPGSIAATPDSPPARNARAKTEKIDLNTATKAELESLPGIGPATASEIVSARPFQSVEDLKKVKGVGETRYQALRSQVTVSHKASAGQTANAESTPNPSDRLSRSSQTSNGSPAPNLSSIDINSADSATLQTLPGVGAVTAQNIIAARPFKSVDDLKEVKGIGETRFEKIRPLVIVRSSARPVTRSSAGTPPGSVKGSSTEAHGGSSPALGKGAEQKATSNTAETKININTASQAELESLLGIGPVKAQAIIDGRPYSSIDDVMKVKGIKEGTFSEIRDRIRVR